MVAELYVYDISADVIDFIDSMSSDKRRLEIEENDGLDERALLMLARGIYSILVLHFQPDLAYLAYCKELLDDPELEVWVTQHKSGEIATDLQEDPVLWPKLLELGQTETIQASSYSTSKGFLNLVSALRGENVTVSTPESPDEAHAWTVNKFGTKSGIRELVTQLQHQFPDTALRMAPGEIFRNDSEAAAHYATQVYLEKNGVVVKTDKGHAGMGVEIVKPDRLPKDPEACLAYFRDLFAKDAYWQQFPIVVEEFLDIDSSIGGGNPNCEYLIGPNGEIKLLYLCGMRVSDQGVFSGVEVGAGILPPEIERQLIESGETLARAYADAGYRGYFDVDAVTTKPKVDSNGVVINPGALYLAESNVRQTGGTHLYLAGEKLIGPDFMNQVYSLCNNTYPIPNEKRFSFTEMLHILQPVLFNKETKEGVVLAGASILQQGKLPYIIFGLNKERAYAIEKEMEKLLS